LLTSVTSCLLTWHYQSGRFLQWGSIGKFFVFCWIQMKFRFWLHKKRWNTSWKFQLEIRSNKKVFAKKPLTNLYEFKRIWCLGSIDVCVYTLSPPLSLYICVCMCRTLPSRVCGSCIWCTYIVYLMRFSSLTTTKAVLFL